MIRRVEIYNKTDFFMTKPYLSFGFSLRSLPILIAKISKEQDSMAANLNTPKKLISRIYI